MFWVIAISMVIVSVVGAVLTLLTLPGAWLIVIAAIGFEVWQPGTFSWWTIGVAAGVGLVGEVLEVAASAAGAKRAGGTRRGAIGGVVGSLVGAVAGSAVVPFVFPIGTIVGAVVGAGVGAALMERTHAHQTWEGSAKVGTGAAIGRFAATIIKTGITGVIGLILTVAAFVR